ncbi:ribbon-helix-helix protein, CopG family, partial [Enterobacter cloacae complex sp.6701988]|uniref:ribbon-helix-helix protein, CopG family n=1 Tax=Enterobacter cloacae complex sp.6701988 TaxID=3397175 RepID=UPI003AACA153
MGVSLYEETRDRIKAAAQRLDRTSHWLIKQAIYNYLEQLDNNQIIPELSTVLDTKDQNLSDDTSSVETLYQPFLEFAEHILPQSVK